jgi:hypothetical protein
MTMTVCEKDRAEKASGVKRCPRCGALLFEDMDTCYGCLYEFGKQRTGELFGLHEVFPWLEAGAWIPEPRTEPDVPYSYVPREASGARGRDREEDLRYEWMATCCDEAEEDELLGLADDAYAQRIEDVFVANADARHYSDVVTVERERTAKRLLSEQKTAEMKLPAHLKTCWALTVEAGSVRMVRPLPAQGLSVGRSQDNDIVLCDRLVSRRHVRVVPGGPGAYVVDQGATNPATVAGRPVEGTEELRENEPLIVGRTVFFLVPYGSEDA